MVFFWLKYEATAKLRKSRLTHLVVYCHPESHAQRHCTLYFSMLWIPSVLHVSGKFHSKLLQFSSSPTHPLFSDALSFILALLFALTPTVPSLVSSYTWTFQSATKFAFQFISSYSHTLISSYFHSLISPSFLTAVTCACNTCPSPLALTHFLSFNLISMHHSPVFLHTLLLPPSLLNANNRPTYPPASILQKIFWHLLLHLLSPRHLFSPHLYLPQYVHECRYNSPHLCPRGCIYRILYPTVAFTHNLLTTLILTLP